VLPAKVRAINRYRANHHSARKRQEWGGGPVKKVVCRQDQERDIHYTTSHKYDIDGKHHLGFKFQKIYPRFHVTNLSLHHGKIKISGFIVAQNFICE